MEGIAGRKVLAIAAAIAIGSAAYLVPGSVAFAAIQVAAPGGDTTVEVQPLTLPSYSSGDARATCPPGKRVVGGGINTTGPVTAGTGDDYLVELSGPRDETALTANTEDGDVARHWYASIVNLTGSSQEFRVFALCSQDSDATVEVQPLSLATGSSDAATATCPPGKRVVGGGVDTAGPVTAGYDYAVELSGPQDETTLTEYTEDGDVARHWYASILNRSFSPQEFKVLALCSQDSDATVEVQPFSLGHNSSGAATATCPPGKRVVGGGVNTTGPVTAGVDYVVELSGPQDETTLTANTEDGDVARHWYASIANHTGSQQDFKVLVLCANDAAGGGPGGGPTPTCGGKAATIVGTPGADTLSGTPNPDVIVGLGGNDVLKGLGGKDRICGGPGKDKLLGGAGADLLNGGPGADRINGGPGKDRCNGGPGVDKVSNC
jgi:Ca2+-binding RTX toxin-like protein